MKLEKRAVFGWGPTAAAYAPCKNGLVVHYDGADQGLASKSHSACRTYWRNTRKFHMNSRGWADIGYAFSCCPHGYVMEGRGWQRQQAAQPGGNSTWTSVTFMSGPSESPTNAQIQAFRELRAWLRGKGLGAAVRGHRDFVSTSCPGSVLYGMVKSGVLIASGVPKPTEPKQEEDMPDYVSIGVGEAQDLPPGKWVTVRWDKEYSDAAHHHRNAGGPSILMGHARYSLTCNVRIEGLTPGVELQARVFEIKDGTSEVVERGPIAEYVASEGATFIHYALPAESVTKGRRVRFEVVHYGTQTARLVSGTAKAHVWSV